ncbi:allantoinase [soil metagenome]
MNGLVIRGGLVVRGETAALEEIAITDGVITEIASSIAGTAREEIDATGAWVFPGFIDDHVHFNEPGRDHWEGLATGSRALALGGGTCFFDMPLNSDPPVLNAERLQEKRAVAEQKSILDFAIWGGLCPGHTDKINEMAEAGAIGFKAFLCSSGIEEFPATDARTLREGLTLAKRWNLPVGVHAEAPSVLDEYSRKIPDKSLRSFFESRPKRAEVESIRMACEIAGETGGKLHVVHVSCAEGLAEIDQAKAAGVDVTSEVCPHYLLFDIDAACRIGATAKCAPPLRDRTDAEALWASLFAGSVNLLGSDHSPAPPDMKTGDDFFAIWGGIAGCQHAFASFLGELHRRAPKKVAAAANWLAGNSAKRFNIAKRKGQLAIGCDADLTLIEFKHEPPVTSSSLAYHHPISLYEGYRPLSKARTVIRCGEVLIRENKISYHSQPGKFIRPD